MGQNFAMVHWIARDREAEIHKEAYLERNYHNAQAQQAPRQGLVAAVLSMFADKVEVRRAPSATPCTETAND